MPETDKRNPLQRFYLHTGGACAIAIVTLAIHAACTDAGITVAFGAAYPNNPALLGLIGVTWATRWIENFDKSDWKMSSIVLDITLGLTTADIIATWTAST